MEPKHKPFIRSAYELADLSYRYGQICADSQKQLVDYGTGELFTPVEVHIVTHIEENPGITVTQIAEQTFRTKSAISQMVTKLEAKDLIRRERDPRNAKQTLLYVTPKGLELSKCHKLYDEKAIPLDDMVALFGREAVDKFADMLEYIALWTLKRRKQILKKSEE